MTYDVIKSRSSRHRKNLVSLLRGSGGLWLPFCCEDMLLLPAHVHSSYSSDSCQNSYNVIESVKCISIYNYVGGGSPPPPPPLMFIIMIWGVGETRIDDDDSVAAV